MNMRSRDRVSSSLPMVSVITICKNARECIPETLESVAIQTYPAVEHIVVDGASTDGTVEFLQANPPRHGRVISEPDQGIADAFNKGIAASRGTWIIMLNAGDCFVDDQALSKLLAIAAASPYALIIAARARCGTAPLPRWKIRKWHPLFLRAHVAHQATLVHRDVYTAYGGYELSFRVRMDLDFFLRTLTKVEATYSDKVLVKFLPGGVSTTQYVRYCREGFRAMGRNQVSILDWILFFPASTAVGLLRMVSSSYRESFPS